MLHLAWEKLGIPQEKLESVARRKHVWNTQFSCCHCDLTSDKKKKKSKMTDDCFNLIILIIWLEVQKYIKVSIIVVWIRAAAAAQFGPHFVVYIGSLLFWLDPILQLERLTFPQHFSPVRPSHSCRCSQAAVMLLSDALETVEDFILNLILNLITILLSSCCSSAYPAFGLTSVPLRWCYGALWFGAVWSEFCRNMSSYKLKLPVLF